MRVATSAALVFCVAEPPEEPDELELEDGLEELDEVLAVVVVDVGDVGELAGAGEVDCATAEVAVTAVVVWLLFDITLLTTGSAITGTAVGLDNVPEAETVPAAAGAVVDCVVTTPPLDVLVCVVLVCVCVAVCVATTVGVATAVVVVVLSVVVVDVVVVLVVVMVGVVVVTVGIT